MVGSNVLSCKVSIRNSPQDTFASPQFRPLLSVFSAVVVMHSLIRLH